MDLYFLMKVIAMRKYINKKCISIFIISIIAVILLYNFFTCPRYLTPIGLESFNGSLIWYRGYVSNYTVIHYSNPFLGEADFGIITLFFWECNDSVRKCIRLADVDVKKIGEKIYNPLIKGFAVTIEGVSLFAYINDTNIDLYAIGSFGGVGFFPISNTLCFSFSIESPCNYVPKKLYVRIDYAVHVIINPYVEVRYQYTAYEHGLFPETEILEIISGFHMKIYSGSVTMPIIVKPE